MEDFVCFRLSNNFHNISTTLGTIHGLFADIYAGCKALR